MTTETDHHLSEEESGKVRGGLILWLSAKYKNLSDKKVADAAAKLFRAAESSEPPTWHALATPPNAGVKTVLAVHRTVIVPTTLMLFDPTEDLYDDASAIATAEAKARDEIAKLSYTDMWNHSVEHKKGETPPEVEGRAMVCGAGQHDLHFALPQDKTKLDAELQVVDPTGHSYEAVVPIHAEIPQSAGEIVRTKPVLIALVRQVPRHKRGSDKRNDARKKNNKPYHWFICQVTDKDKQKPLTGAKVRLVIDVPEERYRTLAVEGTMAASGHVEWRGCPSGTNYVAVPQGRHLLFEAEAKGHIGRSRFERPTGTPEAKPHEVTVALWSEDEVARAMADKWICLDAGHGIAYSGGVNSARVEEWYVCDHALQELRHRLLQLGMKEERVFETRGAGLLLDGKGWELRFEEKYSIKPDHPTSLRGDALLGALKRFLALDADGLQALRKLNQIDLSLSEVEADRQLAARLEHDPAGLVFGAPCAAGAEPLTEHIIIEHLIAERLVDATMARCLSASAEIALGFVATDASRAFDRDYVKKRMLVQARRADALRWAPSFFGLHGVEAHRWPASRINERMRDAVSRLDPAKDRKRRPWFFGDWKPARGTSREHPATPWVCPLAGWDVSARKQFFSRLVDPAQHGLVPGMGLIVSLHLNSDDENHAARGCAATHRGSTSEDVAKVFAKAGWRHCGGLRQSNGVHESTEGDQYFFVDNPEVDDVFVEVDFQDGFIGNEQARSSARSQFTNDAWKKAPSVPGATWRWQQLASGAGRAPVVDDLLWAVVEVLCYPRAAVAKELENW